MAISKVVFGDETLIDLTADTVTADKLLEGATAHGSDGNPISGSLKPVISVNGVKPDDSGDVSIETDETLTLKDGVLSVNTANDAEADNTLPITSAGVYTQLGNIEILLGTI